jgi:farnesyl diphosphate synthase
MAFSQRLSSSAHLVEGHLAAMMDEQLAGGAPGRLVAAMRHGVLGGGKRLRPFLLMESSSLFNVPARTAVRVAAAIECVHCYSLIHDDLPAMDNDAIRRGKPTVHKAFDEWTAILAGDALLTLAFETLASPDTGFEADTRADLLAGLALASGARGMAGGQCLDLEAEKLAQPAAPSSAHVERLQRMKTGALLQFCCEAGAILGRAPAADREALSCFGERLGLAFQIADDLLDVEGDPVAMGKAARKDANKATLHGAIGTAAARARLAKLQDEAQAALSRFGDKARVLSEAAAFVVRREA